jgi:DNA-binding SARP family transcriptional activator
MDNAHEAIRRAARAALDGGGLDDGLPQAVFSEFPHGLLVFAADRGLMVANMAARELLGRAAEPQAAQATCCALLGCRREDSALEGLCVTERTLADGRSLPDLRIDVTVDDEPRGLWVGAAPLTEQRVLIQLRPGRHGDRRRRTEPHWTAGPALRVVALGRTRVLSPEGPLDGAWLRQRPGQLLKLLLCNRHRITHTDEIAMTFWPDNERTALQNVRHFVHGVRTQLEPGRAPRSRSSFIVAHEGGYSLDRGRIAVDVDEFERHARTGLRSWEQGNLEIAQPALERADSLYGGDFLADEPYAEWAFTERALLHELACRVVGARSDLALEAGAVESATRHLQRLARMEPLDSEIQQRLLRLLLARGRSGEALRHYRHAHASWVAAFGEKPDFDLSSLWRQARAAA